MTYLVGIGCGMRATLSTNPKIACFWMVDFDALRMGGLITSTPSGVGSLKIATCPGFVFGLLVFGVDFEVWVVGVKGFLDFCGDWCFSLIFYMTLQYNSINIIVSWDCLSCCVVSFLEIE